jgi:hypothetical protein
MISTAEPDAGPFLFERDTLAFANELFWEYRFDPVTGATTTFTNKPAPTYAHRCFVVVRAARQFYYHARFRPDRPAVELEAYRRLVREVVSRSPRRASTDEDRVVIPGFDGPRSFSQTHTPLLKAECGGPWASYFLRSHWRMVFPVWAGHQERMMRQLIQALGQRPAPIVHLFRFPRITINHAILLFGVTESEQAIQFEAYDPNIPAHPVKLIYERTSRAFLLPKAHYWAGGRVSVIEVYRGGMY